MKIAIVLAEFDRPKPKTENILKYFPEAQIYICDIGDCQNIFPPGPRWGFQMNDYWKVRKLLEVKADIAIALDADMHIVSPDAKVLPLLAKKFGLCLPANPRKLVRVDTQIGADSDRMLDETNGTGYAFNCTPIALNPNNPDAVNCVRTFLEIMERKPVRGPLAWWRAAWETGYSPYLLPPQWCVCAEDAGIGNEIILHVGHDRIRNHYGIPR